MKDGAKGENPTLAPSTPPLGSSFELDDRSLGYQGALPLIKEGSPSDQHCWNSSVLQRDTAGKKRGGTCGRGSAEGGST
jgi:hypothetical protein